MTRPAWLDERSIVPPGTSGPWEVRKFEVSEEAEKFQRLRAILNASRRLVPAGTYTGLFDTSARRTIGGEPVMSDTPDEIRDLWPLMANSNAKGRGLINGLGLGVIVQILLRHRPVERLRIVEIDPDVIKLVEPALREEFGDRVEIIEADALEYKPAKGERFNFAWHDIWPSICVDNLEEMKTLHRRYGRRVDWQGSWCRDECEYRRRQDERFVSTLLAPIGGKL